MDEEEITLKFTKEELDKIIKVCDVEDPIIWCKTKILELVEGGEKKAK